MDDAIPLPAHSSDRFGHEDGSPSDRATLVATGWSLLGPELQSRRSRIGRPPPPPVRVRSFGKERAADRRVAAVGTMTGGVLMAIGTLLPWTLRPDGSTVGIASPWGQFMVVLGILVLMVGLIAMVAPPRGHVWSVLVALTASGLAIAMYVIIKDQMTLPTTGVGFVASVIGAVVGLGAAARGLWLQGG